VEDVEATGPTVHLDGKTSVMILDAKHALVNLHLGPTFIELPKLMMELRSATMK
jgi:hypothetical protein